MRLPEAALMVEAAAALLLEELAEGIASVVGKGVAAVATMALAGGVVRVVAVVEPGLELYEAGKASGATSKGCWLAAHCAHGRRTRVGEDLVGLVERGHLGLATALVRVSRLGRLPVSPLNRPRVGVAGDADDLGERGETVAPSVNAHAFGYPRSDPPYSSPSPSTA